MNITSKDIELVQAYQNDWNKFIRDVLGLRLDYKQREIVSSVQYNRRTSVSSGHARGKDFLAAACSLCFLYLKVPSKVINTAPTARQVVDIMMSEISTIHKNAKIPLGGELLTNKIKFNNTDGIERNDWFLVGFKAADKHTEAWTGYHSRNVFVVATEGSGIQDETFNAIDGLLTGDSRLLVVFNPNRASGEAYRSLKSPLYHSFKLSSLQAPNVRAKKILIPGQVDYEWIKEKLQKPGWVHEIDKSQFDKTRHDFKFDGKLYRPGDLFLVKVLGEPPREAEDVLIPMSWIEESNDRWLKWVKGATKQGYFKKEREFKRIGWDIAGMGSDLSVGCHRKDNIIEKFESYSKSDHMETAGIIANNLKISKGSIALIDTIGEGAGVYSRLKELGFKRIVSAKYSLSANGLSDVTNERKFMNMRAYCYWALRDALDPKFGFNLMIPPNDELLEEASEIKWSVNSQGKIQIESKDDIKKRIGRSPDYADALANTFFPDKKINIRKPNRLNKTALGF